MRDLGSKHWCPFDGTPLNPLRDKRSVSKSKMNIGKTFLAHPDILRCIFKSWDNRNLGYCRKGAHQRSLSCSRSFKVTDFNTNQIPIRDFLLVLNTLLHPTCISHHFQTIADYWSNLSFRQEVAPFNTLVRDKPINYSPQNLASRNQRHHWHNSAVQNAFRYIQPFRRGSRVWRTDWITVSNNAV